MRKLSIAAAIAATAWIPPPSTGDAPRLGYDTSQHGWGSDFKNPTRYRKRARRAKAKAGRKANLRRARS